MLLLTAVRTLTGILQKVENELLEQESHLRLQEVSSMKKAQLVASRTIEKLKDEVVKEEQEWKDHANKTIEELRQENIHLLKLYEAGQVREREGVVIPFS